MKIDVYPEINFSTARSGGSGGQNVNKVETMVEGRWQVLQSRLLADDQKYRVLEKLANRITAAGDLLVKSQTERTQLGNKELVIKKMNELINEALIVKKSRIATKPGKGVKEKRMENKRIRSDVKHGRRKFRAGDY